MIRFLFLLKQKSAVFSQKRGPRSLGAGDPQIFRDKADFNGPGPWEGLPDPKIQVSDPKNENIPNQMLGLQQHDNKTLKSKHAET